MSWHPALARALRVAQACHGDDVEQAGTQLQCMLEQRMRDNDYTGSRLSMNGFPVEIAFSTADRALRYTVDPALPGAAADERVEIALERLAALGAAPVPADTLDAVRRLQQGHALRFGAYLGGRHRAGRHRVKLYFEVPEAAAADAETFAAGVIGRPRSLPDKAQHIEMIGVDPEAGRTEFYSRIRGLIAPDLIALLARVNLGSRYRDLLDLLSECCIVPIWRELPGDLYGFSYSVSARGEPTAFTLYTHARALLGGDSRARARILDLGRRHDWDLRYYTALTEPLDQLDDPVTHHTMFGITVHTDAVPSATFGVAPPLEHA
ncbi:hypothetical protein [Burkholderia alba]|uniref:hypothetical protein n=1 Tax=Burkholderia alba TaxID=2683677 RepID=UPI002B06229F|nr:hypothetical protein [Burkholderia alba]